MPTIADIADDVKAKLDDLVNEMNQLQQQVAQVNQTGQVGFTNLAQGLDLLIRLQVQNNELLAANDRQNVTIICWLDRIAHVACEIEHDMDASVALQRQMLAALVHVDDVLELAHSREAMEVDRRRELEKRLEECCPRRDPEPQPCFTNCDAPRVPDYVPIRTDWKPVRFDRTGQPPR